MKTVTICTSKHMIRAEKHMHTPGGLEVSNSCSVQVSAVKQSGFALAKLVNMGKLKFECLVS